MIGDERIAGTVSSERCHRCGALMIDRGKTHRCPDCEACYPIFRWEDGGLCHITLGDGYPFKIQGGENR